MRHFWPKGKQTAKLFTHGRKTSHFSNFLQAISFIYELW